MKKLMFILAAAALAASAQAASASWKFTGSSNVKGLTVYAFAEALADPTESAIKAATSYGTLPTSGRSFATQGRLDGYAETDQSVSVYLYLLGEKDGQSYYYQTTVSATTYDPTGTANPTIGAYSNTSLPAVGGTGWSQVSAGSGGGGDVPEPTSGLLLLVGGAMLALRRKQK